MSTGTSQRVPTTSTSGCTARIQATRSASGIDSTLAASTNTVSRRQRAAAVRTR
ncbi:hypothetical protein [Fodinicola feengrottensis]|uniref:hypothetical protein n=1 Tax=Fodinicola feengrottensis TaxID=435914 RepID=UPI0024433401|nr:hypothetical protein [Fodinicola feengrottensis]